MESQAKASWGHGSVATPCKAHQSHCQTPLSHHVKSRRYPASMQRMENRQKEKEKKLLSVPSDSKSCFVWKIMHSLVVHSPTLTTTRLNFNRHASPEVPPRMSTYNATLLLPPHIHSEAPKTDMWVDHIPALWNLDAFLHKIGLFREITNKTLQSCVNS